VQFFTSRLYILVEDEARRFVVSSREEWILEQACPDEGMLGAYTESNLLSEERKLVEAHLAECRCCREVIAMVIRTRAIVPDPKICPPSRA
jgi:anti-sigma factor RsiW